MHGARLWPVLLCALAFSAACLPCGRTHAAELLDERSFSDETGRLLTVFAREAVSAYAEGRAPTDRPPAPFGTVGNGVHIVLFREGRLLGEALSRQSTLTGNIRLAAARAAASAPVGMLPETDLVLTVLLPDRPVPGHAPLPIRIDRAWRPGLEGLRVGYAGREALVPPLAGLLRQEPTADLLLALAREVAPPPAGADPTSPGETTRLVRIMAGRETGFRARFVPGVTFARTREGATARLRRLSRPVAEETVTAAVLSEAAARAKRWLAARAAEEEKAAGPQDAREASPTADPQSLPLEEARALFARADALVLAQFGAEEAPAPDLAGSFRHGEGESLPARASAEAVRVLAHAAQEAKLLAMPHAGRYARSVRAGTRFLLELQVRDRIDVLDMPDPADAIGALRPAPAVRKIDPVLTALAYEAFRAGAEALGEP